MLREQRGTADQPPVCDGIESNPSTPGISAAALPPLTVHAQQRHQQRAVPRWAIELALRARPTSSYGALVHRVTDRLLLQIGREDVADRLRGLTVVTGHDGAIITVKWDARLRQRGCLRRSKLGWRGTTPLIHRSTNGRRTGGG